MGVSFDIKKACGKPYKSKILNSYKNNKNTKYKVYGFLQAFFVSKETPTAEGRKEKETLK